MPGFTEILIIIAIILAIFILPKRFKRKSEQVKRAPLKQGSNLTSRQRMAILLSILWLSLLALYLKPWSDEWYSYIYLAIGPVIVYWCIYWICRQFMKKKK